MVTWLQKQQILQLQGMHNLWGTELLRPGGSCHVTETLPLGKDPLCNIKLDYIKQNFPAPFPGSRSLDCKDSDKSEITQAFPSLSISTKAFIPITLLQALLKEHWHWDHKSLHNEIWLLEQPTAYLCEATILAVWAPWWLEHATVRKL